MLVGPEVSAEVETRSLRFPRKSEQGIDNISSDMCTVTRLRAIPQHNLKFCSISKGTRKDSLRIGIVQSPSRR